MVLFHVLASFPFLNENKVWREYSIKEIFTATSYIDAVESAIRWSEKTLEHQVKNYDEHPE